MGTRHLIAVQLDGKYPIAQYGQWDGYPSGQGLTVLKFLRTMDREKFVAALGRTFKPTDEQIKHWWLDVGHDIEKSDGFVSYDIANQFSKNHPSLSRDTGGRILQMVQDSAEPVPLYDQISFAADGLFCEFAYVVDLDKNTFEVFQGFNKEPLAEGERFFGTTSGERDNGYTPVKHVKTYPLDALPTNEQFLADLEPNEDEEEEDDEPQSDVQAAASGLTQTALEG